MKVLSFKRFMNSNFRVESVSSIVVLVRASMNGLFWQRTFFLFYKTIFRNHDNAYKPTSLKPLGLFILASPQNETKSLELSKLPCLWHGSNRAEFEYGIPSLEKNRPQSCLSPERSRRASFLRTRFLHTFHQWKSMGLAARATTMMLLTFCAQTIVAQDVELSQYTLVSPIQNPAFTGAHSGVRMNLVHRNQWTQVPGQFSASFASLDVGSATKKSGLGINVNSYNEGQVQLQTQEATALYGYHSRARIKKQEFSFHLGAGLGYIRRSIDWSNAVFSDQLDPVLGNTRPTEAGLDQLNTYGSIYSSFGTLIEKPFRLPIPYAKNDADGLMRLGYTAQRVLPFRRSFSNANDVIATTQHSFSAMLMLPIHAHFLSKRDLQYLRPAFRYAFQGPIQSWDYSLTWVKRPLLLGTSFRMNKLRPDLIAQDFHQIVLFGSYEIKNIDPRKRWSMQLGYAYDIPLNKISLNAGSTHELFITIYRNSKKHGKGKTSTNVCEEYMSSGGVPL